MSFVLCRVEHCLDTETFFGIRQCNKLVTLTIAGGGAGHAHVEDVGDDCVDAAVLHHPREEQLLQLLRLAPLRVHQRQQRAAQPPRLLLGSQVPSGAENICKIPRKIFEANLKEASTRSNTGSVTRRSSSLGWSET